MKRERTAIYARYSSTNQDGGVSIETQLDCCRKQAGDNPIEYIDRAQSGRTMHRTNFRLMMAAAERGEFTRLVVYKWDRFGRNAETHATIADLEDLGIKVESATEGSDFLARGVGLLVSEDYSKKLSQRVKDAMRVRFKQNGTHLGGSPSYGYRVVKGTDGLSRLEIHPDEAATVRLVYKLYQSESLGVKRLGRRLDELGHRTRSGKPWAWSAINRMLHNKMYTGYRYYGKTSEKLDRRTGRAKRLKNPEFLTQQDESLRIISDKEFAKVQARLKGRVFRDYRLPSDIRAFSQRVFCGCCGTSMYTRHQGLKRKTVTYYLVCGKRDNHGADDPRGCTNPNRPTEEAMIAWVQESFRKVMLQKDAIIKRAVEIAEQSLDTNDARRAKIEAELSKIEQGIARYGRMMMDPKLTDDQAKGLSEQLGIMGRERDAANASLRQLAGEASFDRRALLNEINTAFDEANQSILNVAGAAALNCAIERFCGQIVALPDGTVCRRDDWDGVVPESLPATKGPRPNRLLPAPKPSDADPTGTMRARPISP